VAEQVCIQVDSRISLRTVEPAAAVTIVGILPNQDSTRNLHGRIHQAIIPFIQRSASMVSPAGDPRTVAFCA
jgi:hypothetical protein